RAGQTRAARCRRRPRHLGTEETAALRDFDPAYVGLRVISDRGGRDRTFIPLETANGNPCTVRAISNRTADAASVAVQPSSRSTTKSRLHESLLDFPECREPDLTSARWKVGVE